MVTCCQTSQLTTQNDSIGQPLGHTKSLLHLPDILITLSQLHAHSPSYMTKRPPPSLPKWFILEQAWFIHPKGILPHITHEPTTNSAYLCLPPLLYGNSTAATSPTAHCSTPPSGLDFPNCEMTLYDTGSATFTCMGCPHRPRATIWPQPLMLAFLSFLPSPSFSMGSCAFGTSWSGHFVHDWVPVWT